MTNDTTTLNGALAELGELMASNLVTKGVSNADASDGLTTLANKILLVSGGGSGVSLTIDVDLALSSNSISYGQSVNLIATLTASYDGASVDLSGVLQGATITFKNGNVTIGTATTNSNGVATYSNYTPSSAGTLSISAQFSTIDIFSSASDTATLSVAKLTPTISLSSSSASVYEGTSITLSGTLSVGTGKSVEIYNGQTLVDTVTTTTNGAFSKTLDNLAIGTYSFIAVFDGDNVYDSVTSSSVAVSVTQQPSIGFVDDATTNNLSNYTVVSENNVGYTLTHDATNKYYSLVRNGSSDKFTNIYFGEFDSSLDYVFSIDFYMKSNNPSSGGYNAIIGINDVQSRAYNNGSIIGTWSSSKFGRIYISSSIASGAYSSSGKLGNATWFTFKITKSNGTVKCECFNRSSGSLMFSATSSSSINWNANVYPSLAVMCGSSSTQYFTNIKFEIL